MKSLLLKLPDQKKKRKKIRRSKKEPQILC